MYDKVIDTNDNRPVEVWSQHNVFITYKVPGSKKLVKRKVRIIELRTLDSYEWTWFQYEFKVRKT